MNLAAWSIETSSAKVKQMPFPVGNLSEIVVLIKFMVV